MSDTAPAPDSPPSAPPSTPKKKSRSRPRLTKYPHPGCPTKLTPAFEKQALEECKSLTTEKGLCQALGVTQQTWIDWKHRGEQGEEPFASFFPKIAQAKAAQVSKLSRKVQRAKDWRAAAWMLERVGGESFTPRQRIEHTGKDGAPIETHGTGTIAPPITVIFQGADGIKNPFSPPPPETPPPAQAGG